MIIGLEYLPRRVASSPSPLPRQSRSTAGLIPHPGVYLLPSVSFFPSLPPHLPTRSSTRSFTPSLPVSGLVIPLLPAVRVFRIPIYCPSTRSLYSTLFIYRAHSRGTYFYLVLAAYRELSWSLVCLRTWCKRNCLLCDFYTWLLWIDLENYFFNFFKKKHLSLSLENSRILYFCFTRPTSFLIEIKNLDQNPVSWKSASQYSFITGITREANYAKWVTF